MRACYASDVGMLRFGRGGRFSAPRKAQAVLRLLRGEDLELLSREVGVVASTLSLWREEFLAAGKAALEGKTGKADARDEQISRLKKKVGELTMENEPIDRTDRVVHVEDQLVS